MKIKIYIGKNDGLPNVDRSLAILRGKLDKCWDNVIIVNSSSSQFEYPALKRMWDDSQTDSFYGLYLHCKGASKTDEEQFQNGIAWLEYMLYGLVDNMDLCLDHLRSGADLVGSMWYRHFKGNCFWFKSEYIRGLMDPMTMDTNNRYQAEYWCAQNYWWGRYKYAKVMNLFYIPLDTDNDFIRLKRENYIPSLTSRNECGNISEVIAKKNYSVYNELNLTWNDFDSFKDEIVKHTNYNSVVTIK